MFDFDAFERVGHDLTLLAGPLAGVSTYCCENCGALVLIAGPDLDLVLFHVHRSSRSTERECTGRLHPRVRDTLKAKLRQLTEKSYERMRKAAEDED